MGPLDYRTQVLDPIGMALQGYAQRVAQGQAERQMGQQDRALGQADRRLDMAQEQMTFEMQRARMADQQAAAARAQQEAAQKAYVDYILNPVKTSDSTAAVIRANPQLAEAVMQVWQGQNEEQRRGLAQFGMQFVYALKSGNVDAAKGLLDRRIQAAEAAGDKAQADAFRAERMQLDAGQTDVVLSDAMVTLYGGMSPKEFDDFTKSLPGAAADEPESVKALRLRAEAAGLKPGTQAYAEFMLEGGRIPTTEGAEPDSVRALRIRAQEAGLVPGTPEYAQFMIEGGAKSGLAVDVDPSTGAVSVRQGPGASQKPLTEGQSKDNVYTTRATGALETFEQVADTLTSYWGRVAEKDPTGVARSLMQSEDFQVAMQSGNEFLQAILRKDTGSAITEPEQDLYGKTYLPQPGDGPMVLAAKKNARARALEAMKAGMSAEQVAMTQRALVAAARLAEGAGASAAPASPPAAATPAAAPAPAAPAPAAAPADPLASARQKLATAVQAKGGKLTPEEARAILTEAEYRALIEATGKR